MFEKIRKDKELLIDDIRRVFLWKIDRIFEISDKLIVKLNNLAKADNITIDSPNIKKNNTRIDNVSMNMISYGKCYFKIFKT